jgi:hypothetical protein
MLKIVDHFSTELTNSPTSKLPGGEISKKGMLIATDPEPRVSHHNALSVYKTMVVTDGEAVYPPGKYALTITIRARAAMNEGIM